MTRERAPIVLSSLWMIALTLALFFLPLVNGLLGGFVGGYKAGSPRRGVTAAILPAVVVGIALWIIIALMDAPVLGFISGLAGGVAILLADLGILIGAAAGGYVAENRLRHATPPASGGTT